MDRRTVLRVVGSATLGSVVAAREVALAGGAESVLHMPRRAEDLELLGDGYFIHTLALRARVGRTGFVYDVLHVSDGPYEPAVVQSIAEKIMREGLAIGTICIPAHLVQLVEVRSS